MSNIFYCDMTRFRNMSLRVFFKCQCTRAILRNENIGQSLFKKHSKFRKLKEILYCEMTRFRNVEVGVFRQYQNTKTILKRKSLGRNNFKKLSKFQKFQLSNFTLTLYNNTLRESIEFMFRKKQKIDCIF